MGSAASINNVDFPYTHEDVAKLDPDEVARYLIVMNCPWLQIKRKRITGRQLMRFSDEELAGLGLTPEVIERIRIVRTQRRMTRRESRRRSSLDMSSAQLRMMAELDEDSDATEMTEETEEEGSVEAPEDRPFCKDDPEVLVINQMAKRMLLEPNMAFVSREDADPPRVRACKFLQEQYSHLLEREKHYFVDHTNHVALETARIDSIRKKAKNVRQDLRVVIPEEIKDNNRAMAKEQRKLDMVVKYMNGDARPPLKIFHKYGVDEEDIVEDLSNAPDFPAYVPPQPDVVLGQLDSRFSWLPGDPIEAKYLRRIDGVPDMPAEDEHSLHSLVEPG
uniref:SAM domain-containing protein n=1 Tax=Phaeomonas parva TaxID=124430 RepID=A0A7S1U4W6_9STRA|mmetsp:Transcript_3126/g.8909  ORF Transcript_3126/g.8909 Transcript_3126/m.8909 type:complete len:334 (+) Transcript_3126:127-1128(+)